MEKLKDHYIVCGAGRVGRRIIRNLQKAKSAVCHHRTRRKRSAEFEENGAHILIADATLEENLNQAGVERAKGLASCLADDAANVYVVLTARDMNEDLHIVARAVEEQAEPKLIRAGANRVVAPTIIGSQVNGARASQTDDCRFYGFDCRRNISISFLKKSPSNHDSDYVDKELSETNISTRIKSADRRHPPQIRRDDLATVSRHAHSRRRYADRHRSRRTDGKIYERE